MYDKCYFCLDQLPKLKKEATARFFVNFGATKITNPAKRILTNFCSRLTDDEFCATEEH